MGKKINDGDITGMKEDRFRNSRFEVEHDDPGEGRALVGVSRRTPNTLGGAWQDNRGRRSAETQRSQWDGSPYED